MGKGKRLKGKKKRSVKGFIGEFSDSLTANFQKQIRNSELWDQMVAEFGEQRAEEILKDCKAELKPGPGPDEVRYSPKDIP